MKKGATPDDQAALAALVTPCGIPGSGRVRYGAAMYFNRKGELSDQALEVYRILSPRDGEDPAALLKARHLGREVADKTALAPAALIRTLIDEIDLYLADLPGPGIAEVRQGLGKWRMGPVTCAQTPTNAVVQRWLGVALAAVQATHPGLAHAIAAAGPYLNWVTFDGYPLDAVGAEFARGHAYVSLVGEDAALPACDWDMGLFLIAPDILYRDHRHPAPELYAPLTGPHGWRFGPDAPLRILPAHRPVWNPPNRPHLTKVGPVPFMALFAWTRDVNAGASIIPATDWPELEQLRLTGDGRIVG